MPIIRKTKSVNTLLNIFEKTDNAISVVGLVKQLHQKMNKTTVYRILERLDEEGILHSFIDKNGLKWYAKCNDCSMGHHIDTHPHFQCNDCGKVECLNIEVTIPKLHKHHIESAELLLVGQCENCK